jgi:hypothetical protein
MNVLVLIIASLIGAIILLYLTTRVNFRKIFGKYCIDLTIESRISFNEYTDSITIANKGGRIIEKLSLDVRIEVGGDLGKNIETTRHEEYCNIQCGERISIKLLTSDSNGIFVGGTTLFHGNKTNHAIIWNEDYYAGTLECSYDHRSMRKYLTLERNEYSVRAYLHDY